MDSLLEPDWLNYWEYFLEEYAEPIGIFFVSILTTVYLRLTLINIAIFILKYVPTGLYMYKLAKGVYMHTRRRIQQKKVELKEVQLEIELVNTKLCVRDAEIQERTTELQRATEHLKQLRARVRHVIASSSDLQRVLDSAEHSKFDSAPPSECGSWPENEFVNDLIKELQKGWINDTFPEKEKRMDSGEQLDGDGNSTEGSVYSSIVDGADEMKQDCRVRIVKVTNVYKVAYLRNYIKQKRLRRASKQAILKKKMDSIKQLLENWQKALNAVINIKPTILDESNQTDDDSDDGEDYPNVNNCFSGNIDDIKEVYFEQHNLGWQYNNNQFNCADFIDPNSNRETYALNSYSESTENYRYEYNMQAPMMNQLFVLPEETNSQLAIEESMSENGEMNDTD